MPPRHTYWTIILEGKPTAFRAHTEDELLPTLKQLQAKHPDAVMRWFARGKLWHSPDEERLARMARAAKRENRGRDWRPGGTHRDPRERFQIPRDERRRRFRDRLARDRRDPRPPRPDTIPPRDDSTPRDQTPPRETDRTPADARRPPSSDRGKRPWKPGGPPRNRPWRRPDERRPDHRPDRPQGERRPDRPQGERKPRNDNRNRGKQRDDRHGGRSDGRGNRRGGGGRNPRGGRGGGGGGRGDPR